MVASRTTTDFQHHYPLTDWLLLTKVLLGTLTVSIKLPPTAVILSTVSKIKERCSCVIGIITSYPQHCHSCYGAAAVTWHRVITFLQFPWYAFITLVLAWFSSITTFSTFFVITLDYAWYQNSPGCLLKLIELNPLLHKNCSHFPDWTSGAQLINYKSWVGPRT